MSEIPNPFMHIASDGKESVPTLFAPVKGRGLLVTPLERPLAIVVWRLIVQSRIRAGAEVELAEADRDALRRIGALIPSSEQPSEVHFVAPDLAGIDHAMAERPVADAADELERLGHVLLDEVLPADHVALVNDYATRLAREGWAKRQEGFSDRFAAHNSAAGRAYHGALATLVSRIARRPLVPSYSYLTSYLPGATLPTHTDRPQCDFTFSMHLGQEGPASDDWPFELQRSFDDERLCTYHCRPGQAVLFRGIRLPHRRPPWKGAGLYNQMLWHFVEEGFEGSLD